MNIDSKTVNELRVLSAEIITNAKSGHTGIALGSAPILYSLYANVLAVDCDDPKNFNRDRFVLSAGHGSSILYSILYGMGYNLTNDDLKNFRELGSKTPGHPEVNVTEGVDCSTGPLGQGVANAVGMAIAQKHMSSLYNKKDCKIFDSKIFCLCGDGCLMEGVSQEALSLAGNLNLDNFVLIYDCNKITIEGKTDITFTENTKLKFESLGFDVLQVKDGNNVDLITKNLLKARQSKKPTLVIVNTQIGFGSELAGSNKIHGKPLNIDELEKLKCNLKVLKPSFDLSNDVKDHLKQKSINAKQRLKQQSNTQEYKKLYPKEWKELKSLIDGKDYSKEIEKIKKIKMTESQATRDINGDILTQVAEILPNMLGGSADVAVSTMAFDKNAQDFSAKNYAGKLIRFGVREHAMASISNGIALFGFNLPYQSCFMSFFDYLKPAFRMSALMNICTLLTLSHDSILSGEDGPTHQPIEQLPSIRMIPNTIVSRPYNFTEIVASYVWLLQYKKPTVICVSKDKPTIKQSELEKALCGGYILHNDRRAQLTIVTTGADVTLALNILDRLKENKVYARLVSMPCVDIFEKQKPVYKKSVLKDLPIVFLESSAENCWYKMAKPNDLVLSLNSFGTSAHPLDVQKYMKFDPESLSKRIETWIKKLQNQIER